MPDLLSFLRMANIFGDQPTNPGMENGGMMASSLPQQQSPEIQQQPNQLQQAFQPPQRDISSQLISALGEQPTRDQYSKPGIYSNIMASLASLGKPIGTRDAILNKSFDRDTSDWKTKVDALMKGSTSENQINTTNRLLASAGINANLGKERVEISRTRAAADDFAKRNPNWIGHAVPGGNVIYINPKDPSQNYDTGIESGKLTDEDRIELQTTGRLRAIEAQSAAAKDLEGTKQGNRETNIGLTGDEARKTKSIPSGNKEDKDTPTQEKVKHYNNAQKAILEHPEWEKYIHLNVDGPNTLKVDPPAGDHWYSSGTPPEIHKAINAAILGESKKPVINKETAGQTTIKVISPDGKVGSIPFNQLDEALKNGYKKVQ